MPFCPWRVTSGFVCRKLKGHFSTNFRMCIERVGGQRSGNMDFPISDCLEVKAASQPLLGEKGSGGVFLGLSRIQAFERLAGKNTAVLKFVKHKKL